MVRHNDKITDLDHWVVGMYAFRQFLLHHPSHLRQCDFRSLRITVRLADIADDTPQWLLSSLFHVDGDMINARPAVIFSAAAPSHVSSGLFCLFYYFFFMHNKRVEDGFIMTCLLEALQNYDFSFTLQYDLSKILRLFASLFRLSMIDSGESILNSHRIYIRFSLNAYQIPYFVSHIYWTVVQ